MNAKAGMRVMCLLGALVIGYLAAMVYPPLQRWNNYGYYPQTPYTFTDNGSTVTVSGIIKPANGSSISYPANGFQSECSRNGCRTFLGWVRGACSSSPMIDTRSWFDDVTEFTPQRIVFRQEHGPIGYLTAGAYNVVTVSIDRTKRRVQLLGQRIEDPVPTLR